jgi:hypothetical protein
MSAPRGFLWLRDPDDWVIEFVRPGQDDGIPEIDVPDECRSFWEPFERFVSELPWDVTAAIDRLPTFEGIATLLFFFARWQRLELVRAAGVVHDLAGAGRGRHVSFDDQVEPIRQAWERFDRAAKGGAA